MGSTVRLLKGDTITLDYSSNRLSGTTRFRLYLDNIGQYFPHNGESNGKEHRTCNGNYVLL